MFTCASTIVFPLIQVQRLQAAQQEQAQRASAAASEAAANVAELAALTSKYDALQLEARQLRQK